MTGMRWGRIVVALAAAAATVGWGGPVTAQPPPAATASGTAILDAALHVAVRDGLRRPGQRATELRTETVAYLTVGGDRIPVGLDQVGTTRPGPVRVRVHGIGQARAGDIVANLRAGTARIAAIEAASPDRAARRDPLGTHPVNIVPVSWSGSAAPPSASAITESMEFATRFWSDNTDGQLRFATKKIYPATRISISAADVADCNNWAIQTAVQRAYPGLQGTDTEHLVIVMPWTSSCWWGGLATYEEGVVWINGEEAGSVYAHEFGHNLGLGHGASLTCYDSPRRTRAVTFSDHCESQTYDDPWDIMGARAVGNLSSANAWRIGAIPDSARAFVDRSQSLTLTPVAADEGIRSVVFEAAGRTFEMEYRIPTGWDDWINSTTFLHSDGNRYPMPGGGVIVRLVEAPYFFSERQEVNFHPEGAGYHYERHPGLDAGGSYTFPGGPTISVQSATAAGATVRFTLGKTPAVTRWYGADRYATSATISRYGFYTPTGTVHVANGSVFTDALSGAGVAAMAPGPLFLVKRDSLTAPVSEELSRLNLFDSTVFGGPNSISPDIDSILSTQGRVTRYVGKDRYEASAAISRGSFEPGVEVAYVASGLVFPDALSGAPVAGMKKAPMLLTAAGSLPASIADELERLQPRSVVVLGGPDSISDDVVAQVEQSAGVTPTRISGEDRYAVSALIAEENFTAGQELVLVASGELFSDALSGAPVAGSRKAPLLLVKGHSIPSPVVTALKRLKPKGIVILGGPATVSPGVEASLAQFVTG